MNKVTLRKTLLQRRQAMAPEEWQQKSLQICEQLQHLPLFIEAKTVLAYFSIRQEPDLMPLFTTNKVWGFSRCVGKQLIWHHWSPHQAMPLQSGTYGILEPPVEAPLIDTATVDLILLPAIACDSQGYRLGYGGGFYDRLLSAHGWHTKSTIGIIFEHARIDQLPRDAWDRALDGVCTEAGFFATQNR